MTLVVPELKLMQQQSPGEGDEYILESKAFFPNENFVANGYTPVPISLNSANDLDIEILITDGDSSNNSDSSIVEHLLNLGSLDFEPDIFYINVEIKKGNTKKGKGHIRNVDAVRISRPKG